MQHEFSNHLDLDQSLLYEFFEKNKLIEKFYIGVKLPIFLCKILIKVKIVESSEKLKIVREM